MKIECIGGPWNGKCIEVSSTCFLYVYDKKAKTTGYYDITLSSKAVWKGSK